MYVVACSCRVRMNRMSFSSRNAAIAPYSCTPGSPNTTRTPSRCNCFASASPPVIRIETPPHYRSDSPPFERGLCRRNPPQGEAAPSTPLGVRGASEGGRSPPPSSGVFPQLEAAELAAMHLVRSVSESQRARVRLPEGERELLA